MGGDSSAPGSNVNVVARVRPLTSGEQEDGCSEGMTAVRALLCTRLPLLSLHLSHMLVARGTFSCLRTVPCWQAPRSPSTSTRCLVLGRPSLACTQQPWHRCWAGFLTATMQPSWRTVKPRRERRTPWGPWDRTCSALLCAVPGHVRRAWLTQCVALAARVRETAAQQASFLVSRLPCSNSWRHGKARSSRCRAASWKSTTRRCTTSWRLNPTPAAASPSWRLRKASSCCAVLPWCRCPARSSCGRRWRAVPPAARQVRPT